MEEEPDNNIKTEYYRIVAFAKGVTKKGDLALLMEFDKLCNKDGRFSITTQTRDNLCTALKINKSNLSAATKRLLDLKVINGSKGEYFINEELFIKESNEPIEVKLTIYNSNNCIIYNKL